MPLNPDLKAKLDSATEHYEALLASERDRASYLLASMICDPIDPEKSIAEAAPKAFEVGPGFESQPTTT